jgi:hypothetical protein
MKTAAVIVAIVITIVIVVLGLLVREKWAALTEQLKAAESITETPPPGGACSHVAWSDVERCTDQACIARVLGAECSAAVAQLGACARKCTTQEGLPICNPGACRAVEEAVLSDDGTTRPDVRLGPSCSAPELALKLAGYVMPDGRLQGDWIEVAERHRGLGVVLADGQIQPEERRRLSIFRHCFMIEGELDLGPGVEVHAWSSGFASVGGDLIEVTMVRGQEEVTVGSAYYSSPLARVHLPTRRYRVAMAGRELTLTGFENSKEVLHFQRER